MWHFPCFHLCAESTDEEVDKLHCLNHSGSSATYSDYSPSQGSSGSSNPPANPHVHTHSHPHKHTPALPAPSKDQAPQTHWTNRYTHTHSLPFRPTAPSISSIYHHSFNVLSALSSHSLFFPFTLSSIIIKVRETRWHVQVSLSFSSQLLLCSVRASLFQAFFYFNSWGPSDEIVSLIALLISHLTDPWGKTHIKRNL